MFFFFLCICIKVFAAVSSSRLVHQMLLQMVNTFLFVCITYFMKVVMLGEFVQMFSCMTGYWNDSFIYFIIFTLLLYQIPGMSNPSVSPKNQMRCCLTRLGLQYSSQTQCFLSELHKCFQCKRLFFLTVNKLLWACLWLQPWCLDCVEQSNVLGMSIRIFTHRASCHFHGCDLLLLLQHET